MKVQTKNILILGGGFTIFVALLFYGALESRVSVAEPDPNIPNNFEPYSKAGMPKTDVATLPPIAETSRCLMNKKLRDTTTSSDLRRYQFQIFESKNGSNADAIYALHRGYHAAEKAELAAYAHINKPEKITLVGLDARTYDEELRVSYVSMLVGDTDPGDTECPGRALRWQLKETKVYDVPNVYFEDQKAHIWLKGTHFLGVGYN